MSKRNKRPYEKVKKGSVVGRLTVLYVDGRSKNGSKIWKCKCECGKQCHVVSSNLNNSTTRSCGCLLKEDLKTRHVTHNMSKSNEFSIWENMKSRCYNPNATNYGRYGALGVEVCDRWLDSFENFYNDMGDRPEGMSLDRIDTAGNYCPENCRWTDATTQARNRAKSRTVKYSSKYKGVSFISKNKKWKAFIGVLGKEVYLGLFETEEEAYSARLEAEEKYWK